MINLEFIIQSKDSMYNRGKIPMHEFGYATIEAIDYKNWWDNKTTHSYILMDEVEISKLINHRKSEVVPVGSVEFCLDYYSKIGVGNIKPLNIPEELWKFVKRKVCIDYCKNINGHWFLKSTDKIKSDDNGEVFFNGDGGEDKKYFLTEYVSDIVSEWRLFVYNKEILGLKCYSGDEWILPNKSYCEEIVKAYDKKSFTLDAMISKQLVNGVSITDLDGNWHNRIKYITDIVEIHDFFACGLYGFNHPKLLDMMITTQRELLNRLDNV